MLDNVDRRKVEKLKDFLRNIPFLSGLPRGVMNTLHLSLTKKKYLRGQVVCQEGMDSQSIFIVCKGEFEVSKYIDLSKADTDPTESLNKSGREYLPMRKLV